MTDQEKKRCCQKWEEMSGGLKALIIVGGVIVGAGLLILFGFVVMWLWNWLMPKIFSLPRIGYWEAWGLVILSHILFGHCGSGSGATERSRKRRLRKRIREMDDGQQEDPGVCPA